ncbi:MAG: hypothetical protein IKO26_07000 [Paludibacteraceae bacterium]|nr:hypothetical protein [Paludibacteraceae bacterium]
MKREILQIIASLFVMTMQAEEIKHDTVYVSKVDTIYIAKAVVMQPQQTEIITDTTAVPKRNSFGAKLKESHFHFGLELQTKYMWRGIEYGTAPTLFPQISFNNWGLNIYAMGGYAVNGSHSEVDLGISYSFYGVMIGLNDYYYPTMTGEDDRYFNFKHGETGHYLEACIGYYPEKLPFWILASTYVAGADLFPGTTKNAYSSYLEVGLHYDFFDNHQIALACGLALNKSFYNDYEKKFSVSNVMLQYTYYLRIKWWTLPLKAALVYNPYRNKFHFTASAYFGF